MKNIISILIIVAFVAVGYFLISDSSKSNYVYIGGQKIQVELAVTVAERTQGLSGRKSLSEGTGLLFIFDKSGFYPFWMKDMNFPIDIIWLGEDFRIVSIEQNVSPKSYPKTLGGDKEARYVLEVVAGFSEMNNLKVGDKVEFTY